MTSKATITETARLCLCGSCHEAITTKALYKPGHDARHVSVLLGGLFNTIQDGGKVTQRMIDAEAKSLPSEALQRKFRSAAERMLAQAAKAEAEAEEAGK